MVQSRAPWGMSMCVLALLQVWYYDMELIPFSSAFLLLSAYSMTRGQEETSTSQAGRRKCLAGIHLLQAVSSPLCHGGVDVLLSNS